jgi:hypothetical protein
VHELPQIAIGLQQRRSDPPQKTRLHLARHAEHKRCDDDDQEHLQGLQTEICD